MPNLLDINLSKLHRSCLRASVLTAPAFLLLSCDSHRPAEPVITQYVKVINVNSDTMVVIPNGKSATTASIAFSETLSDTALVRISSDTAFSKHGSLFLLPITNSPLTYISGLSGDSLFININHITNQFPVTLQLK
jgi:hypothetical protein